VSAPARTDEKGWVGAGMVACRATVGARKMLVLMSESVRHNHKHSSSKRTAHGVRRADECLVPVHVRERREVRCAR
jgi:hypothetical protein